MTPDIRSDPEYDEPVNIDMDGEDALRTLLDAKDEDEDEQSTDG